MRTDRDLKAFGIVCGTFGPGRRSQRKGAGERGARPRRRRLRKRVVVSMTPLESALTGYYAERYDREHASIVRGMVKQYVKADTSFDPGAFLRFVVRNAPAGADRDQAAERAALEVQARKFVADIERGR